MNVHPFLQKQGINSVQLYPGFSEQVKKQLHEIWNIDLPVYDQDLVFTAPFILGNDSSPDLFIIIKDKQIIDVRALIVPEQVLVLKQHKKFFQSISISLAKNIELKTWFNSLLRKWELPQRNPWKFFKELSGGRNELFLPCVIRNEGLINDINELCSRLNLRKEISEEFWTVSAYLLFRNSINNENLHYFFMESEGVFKIQSDDGYQLFLKLNSTLNYNLWVKLSVIINEEIRRKDKFVPGDGNIHDLTELINNIPEWCASCKVYSIPAMFDQCWSEEYMKNRNVLDKLYFKIRTPRVTGRRKKTLYVITKLNERIRNNIQITMSVCKEIAREVDLEFDPEGNKDPYSEGAVFRIYTDYVREPE